MLNFCDFIQVYIFTTNHHLKYKHQQDEILKVCYNVKFRAVLRSHELHPSRTVLVKLRVSWFSRDTQRYCFKPYIMQSYLYGFFINFYAFLSRVAIHSGTWTENKSQEVNLCCLTETLEFSSSMSKSEWSFKD